MKLGLDIIQRAYLGATGLKAVARGGEIILAESALLLHFNGNLADSSPSDHAVSAFGDATFGVGSGAPGTASGGAAEFADTEGTYMAAEALGSEFAFGAGDFTVEAWVYPIAAPSGDLSVLVDTRDSGGTTGFALWYDATTSKWGAYMSSNNNLNQAVAGGTSAVALSTWTHVAATRRGNTLRLFVNGIQEGSADVDGYSLLGASCWIGTAADVPGDYRNLIGYLDDLRIVKGMAVYTGPFTPPAAELSSLVRHVVPLAIVEGCTDPLGTNYDPAANVDNGSCSY